MFLDYLKNRVKVCPMKHLLPSKAAQILGVKTVTVRAWLNKGMFPNAYLEQTEFFAFPVWRIPEDDIEKVIIPPRGRPKKSK